MGISYKENPAQEGHSYPSLASFFYPPLSQIQYLDELSQRDRQDYHNHGTMMSVTTEVRHSNLDAPRSPVSISTDSSRRGSLNQLLPEHPEPPTPISPPTSLTRKRAASLITDIANEPRLGELALNSASTNGPDLAREQVCLCQPDPKIPRPRNAFILYRQHYQAQVVAQHPGLANPEISKIIGEQWREQAPEVKSDWKRLAEEEKQRHQRQYPGYRYQPRRAGKLGGIRPISSSADVPIRCPKCNGRYISTPSTPLTPFTPSFGAAPRNERTLPPFTQSHPNELERARYSTQMQNTRMDTPRVIPNHQQSLRRPHYPPPQSLQSHHERDEDLDLPSPSPGLKRRRFNEENHRGYAANSPVSYSAPQPFSRQGAPPPMSAIYRQQLPGPAMLARHGSMGPPPSHSPINQQPRHQYSNRSTFDESLRLPPLQTQMVSATPMASQRPDSRMEIREIHARSVEAMVMTIPYISKIKVLTKISPPLARPGPQSPAQETRGAVVAIEGPDKALLAEIGTFIDDYLSKDPTFALRAWSTTAQAPQPHPAGISETETTDTPAVDVQERDPFVEYFSVISEWHRKSLEMTKYITTAPPPPAAEPASGLVKKKVLPVALVPGGFSLSTSDNFALRIPINDSYAPVDHWQWMATLWRGIIGPDLTIYVNRVGRDELNKYSGVEVRSDCPCIVVRVPEGPAKMDEKTARRLGFEVVEFVRNVESGFGRP
ncbi:hypothetical protein LZ554_005990 [Drepanopeziza brunnea f. sp. 'monogermtubi']|nr:hypothetical protein LZ554_005990 [Drepanopeziza brunnea f. sp. 'monogermtubi']